MNVRVTRTVVVLGLAALAIGGRMLLLPLPGISFSFLVVFLAGIAFGVRTGATVGFLGRFASDLLISGLNPILVPMALVEATLGALSGLLGRHFSLGQWGPVSPWAARSNLFSFGVFYPVAFSLLADTYTWLFYHAQAPGLPDAHPGLAWATLVLNGLAFNVPAVAFNAALFPLAVPTLLRTLRRTGLVSGSPAPPAPVHPTQAPGS